MQDIGLGADWSQKCYLIKGQMQANYRSVMLAPLGYLGSGVGVTEDIVEKL